MTPGPSSSRDDRGDDRRTPDADPTLQGFAARHHELLLQRALVVAHVHGVDAQEIFALTRAAVWLRWDELAAAPEADRLVVLWLLLARHARGADRPDGDRSATPAVHDLSPRWRPLDPRSVLEAPETTVFRAMAHLGGLPRDVLVLCWLGVGADDVAEELGRSPQSVRDALAEARQRLRHLLDAGASR